MSIGILGPILGAGIALPIGLALTAVAFPVCCVASVGMYTTALVKDHHQDRKDKRIVKPRDRKKLSERHHH